MIRYASIGSNALFALGWLVASVSGQSHQEPRMDGGGVEYLRNAGQWHHEALWLARTPGLDFWLSRHGFVVDSYRYKTAPGHGASESAEGISSGRSLDRIGRDRNLREGQVFTIEIEGAVLDGRALGSLPRAGVCNYLKGNVDRHVSEVKPWGQVDLDSVLPGIDLRLLSDGGRPRYDFVVNPGGSVDDIVLRVRGAEQLSLRDDGTLVLRTSLGAVVMDAPVAYQQVEDQRRHVDSSYRWLGGGRIGFELGHYDEGLPLVIDPTVYSTVIGGSGEDSLLQVAVAPNGDTVVVGQTVSSNFPVTAGVYSTSTANLDEDYLLARFDPNGTRLFSTRIGGSNEDYMWDLELAASGDIWISGYTNSQDFPTAGVQISSALSSSGSGYGDAMICAVNGAGTALIYGTFLGGSGTDVARAIKFDGNGDLIIAGGTSSNGMPVTANAVQAVRSGSHDAFVARLDLAAGLQYFTYLGGSGYERLLSLAVSGSGEYICAGYTQSTNFPVTAGAFDLSHNSPSAASPGNRDGFVFRIDESAMAYVATYYGGAYVDEINDCVVDPVTGNVVVAGISGGTTIAPLPMTAGSYQPTTNGGYDGFMASFSADLSTLVWGTWVGGSGSDGLYALARGPAGNYWATGYTRSANFPNTTTSLYQAESDAVLVVLDSTGSTLQYSTLRGGSGREYGYGIAVDAQARASICGLTDSSPHPPGPFVFPWTGFPASRRYGTPLSTVPGVWEGFVMRIATSVSPGVAAKSTNLGSTCAPAGFESTLYMSPPFIGQPFSLSVSGQPGGVAEVFLGGVGQFVSPPCTILLAPGTAFVLSSLTLDANGYASVDTTLPALPGLIGLTLRSQAVVLGPGGSLAGAGVSNAVEFTFGQ